jgi:hypothetical protein
MDKWYSLNTLVNKDIQLAYHVGSEFGNTGSNILQ